MKKIHVLVTVIAFSAFDLSAQTPRFGFTAGTTSSFEKIEENNNKEVSSSISGFTAGILTEIGISENFVLQPVLNFTQKGGADDITITSGTTTIKIDRKRKYNFLELPINFLYQIRVGSGKFFAGAGPVISWGLNGKYRNKISGSNGSSEEEGDINFGSSDNELKPLEFSGNILAGFELSSGVYFSLNYNTGFSNLMNEDPDNNSLKNRYFGLRVGYAIKKK